MSAARAGTGGSTRCRRCCSSASCCSQSHVRSESGVAVPDIRAEALAPPRWIRRQALRERVRAQFVQGTRVDPALEIDDVVDRVPPVHPAPAVELRRLLGRVEAQCRIPDPEFQEIPALLLSDAERRRITPDELRRQAVAQPALGSRDYFDLLRT